MYYRVDQGWRRHLDFIMIDAVCLQISFVMAQLCRNRNININSIYINIFFVLICVDIAASIIFQTMDNVVSRGYFSELKKTIFHTVSVMLCISFYLVTVKISEDFSRYVFMMTFVIYLPLTYITRISWKIFIKKAHIVNKTKSLLMVCDKSNLFDSLKIVKKRVASTYDNIKVLLIDEKIKIEQEDIFVAHSVEDALNYVIREWVDEIYINIGVNSPLTKPLLFGFSEMGITTHFKMDNSLQISNRKQVIETLDESTVLTTAVNYVTQDQLFIKRAMDIIGGLIGCFLTSVIFVFLAPIIYVKSPGPIFFSQIRVGKNGEKFTCYKFRSMYLDAEERKSELMGQNKAYGDLIFKMDDDPRIIGSKILSDGTYKKGIGNFIREFSIDEFPQFWNVLKGEMSLVGTRPPTVDEWEKYKMHHRVRLSTKPGITGVWQVNGRSNIKDFEKIIKMESEYIADWNIGKDIKIILKTIMIVLKKEGSV